MSNSATRRRARIAAASAVAIAAVGCGGAATRSTQRLPSAYASGFSWLSDSKTAGWREAMLPDHTAALPYPPGWRREQSDRGTVSAADRRGSNVGYLNLTPRQGDEQPHGWATFRLHHNAAEGNRHQHQLGAAERLRFRTGRGSCVVDDYRTSKHVFREIACLVTGAHATAVVVGAAPPSMWKWQGPLLERAIASVRV